MILPIDIQEVFYDTLDGGMPIPEFERWLYANKQLEQFLNAEDYLDLISFDYRARSARYDLLKLLEKHVSRAELETRRVQNLLKQARNKKKTCAIY